MTKLTSVLTVALVSGGALLAFSSPAFAQYPCYGCGDSPRIEQGQTFQAQLPCYNCVDNPRIEQGQASAAPVGIAALGGLTAAGLAGLALRRRRAA